MLGRHSARENRYGGALLQLVQHGKMSAFDAIVGAAYEQRLCLGTQKYMIHNMQMYQEVNAAKRSILGSHDEGGRCKRGKMNGRVGVR